MNEISLKLIQSDPEQVRTQFVLFLKSQLGLLNGEISEVVKVAYEIAGLTSTDFAQSMSPSDPIDEILTIAGELEIHPDNAEELRIELINKIQAL